MNFGSSSSPPTQQQSRRWQLPPGPCLRPVPAFEVQAQNNAEIEGDQFFARADLVTYDHESKLVVMRALENRHATLWYYETPHSPRSRYDVKMARLSPNGNILELDRTRGASASQ